MLTVADSGVSPEDSFMVFIADAAKMEEKRASLAGIAAEVELAVRQEQKVMVISRDQSCIKRHIFNASLRLANNSQPKNRVLPTDQIRRARLFLNAFDIC
ncbi:hypothetical protein [Undibacterium sp. MH2W]|uniref:hypothetical protein n=1 Tax=Undibacterium sp. MH2W TaxID=3413044 RepID=UPI003BF50C6F